MKQVNWKKLLLPNLPYVFIALFCTKLGQAARLAPGTDFAGKFLHFMEGLSAAFAVPLPSFRPADLCVGIAIAAAIRRDISIHEYAPMNIKMAITGQGQASKEQVAAMLQRLLNISSQDMPKFMDATDALAAAYCHFMQMGRPETDTHYKGWKDFVAKNQERLCKK